MTNDEYHKLGNTYNNISAQNYNHENGMQNWKKTQTDWEYSPVFVDLIDNFNQRNSGWNSGTWHNGNTNYPNDRITGYSISYININILGNSYGLSSLLNSIKSHKLTGISDTDVDDLFALYW